MCIQLCKKVNNQIVDKVTLSHSDESVVNAIKVIGINDEIVMLCTIFLASTRLARTSLNIPPISIQWVKPLNINDLDRSGLFGYSLLLYKQAHVHTSLLTKFQWWLSWVCCQLIYHCAWEFISMLYILYTILTFF